MKKAIVIGAGFMGLQVSARLAEKGWKVCCFDGEKPYSASKNCSGWVNPFQFRFPSWKSYCFEILTHQSWYYESLFPIFNKNLYPIKIWRPCNMDTQNSWMAFASTVPFQEFQIFPQNISPFTNKAECGLIFHSLILKPQAYIEEAKTFLKNKYEVEFINKNIDYQMIKNNSVSYELNKIHYDLLFFCEGFYGKENPFFLEAQSMIKVEYGDFFEISWEHDMGFYHEHYGLSFAQKLILGSRHETDELLMQPNVNEYKSSLYKVTEKQIDTIITIKEGKRPAQYDGKKPILLTKDSMIWLNGLGSRGILYSGWFSSEINKFL